mgnify:CR=1 FL=1
MAFEGLSDKLGKVFSKLKNHGKLNEKDVKEAMREVKMALLEADVSFPVVKDFVAKVSERAVGSEVMNSLTPAQQVIDIVHDELIQLMGTDTARINFPSKPPCVIMMCGLQGAGKTTHTAKLAKYLKKQNRRPLLVACDIYRPAAIDQLKVVGASVDAHVFEMGQTNPVKIAKESIKYAKDNGFDVVILDTAGRLHIDEDLMNELKDIKAEVQPNEILLVVDSMTGQDAVNTAKEFNERLDFNGVVLTKLDGDTRGGAALSIRSVVNKPIKFVGTGEKLEAIDQFHPARMADRILGMGDIVSLVERAQEQYDEEEAKRLQKKIAKNQFDFNDFLSQIAQIKKMGNLKDLASMIPGVGKAIKDIDIDDNAFKSIEAIIYSMTPAERSNPEILNGSRRTRIAKGSGTTIQEVNRLLKQFDQTRKMMKMVTSSKMGKMMPKMKK